MEKSPRKKNSKWAALAAERQGWDDEFKDENVKLETSTKIIVKPASQTSARDMVQAIGVLIDF